MKKQKSTKELFKEAYRLARQPDQYMACDVEPIISEENFFDYAEAIHCYATLNHDGMGSTLYSILSRSEFKPGPMWTESRCENENPVYSEIDEDNIEDLFAELCAFIKNRKAV